MQINPQEYITYYKNEHSYYKTTGSRYYNYCSHVEAPSGPTWEIKLQIPSNTEKYCGFCSQNYEHDEYNILEISSNGFYCWSGDDGSTRGSVKYSSLTPTVDGNNPVVLYLSSDGCTVNGINANMSFDGMGGISMFTAYGYEDRCAQYNDCLPEGSKIYYVKVWNSNDELIYIGHPGKESTSDQWGWHSVTDTKETYEYAWTYINMPDGVTITPYGHGYDL